MNCEETTELLSDRLKGLASEADEARLTAHLSSCPACREEAEAVTNLWADLGTLDDDVPHERMRARFHAALAAYEARADVSGFERFIDAIWPRRPVLQASLAGLMLIVGFAAGQRLPSSTEREIAELRGDIQSVGLVLLGHQSASERLRGVEWSRQGQSDLRVVDALLDAVQNDSNINVRLAAVEALNEWLDRPQVGSGLANALDRQDAPLMQVTLARVLLDGNVDGAIPAIQRVVERENLEPSVRDYLRTVLQDAGDRTAETGLL